MPGPAPAGGPISCTDKKWGKEAAGGHAPLTPAPPPVGLRPKSAAPRPRISERAYSIPPSAAPRAQCLCRRVSGTVPKVRPGRHGRFCVARSAHGEAENCAATPRTRAERANARNGRCFPPCVPGEPSSFICWERPQPELSPQLVYLWGVTVTGGYWQGVSRGFQRTRRRVLWRPSLVTFFGVKKVTRRRSTTDKLRRSMSGKSKPTPGRDPAAPPLAERTI